MSTISAQKLQASYGNDRVVLKQMSCAFATTQLDTDTDSACMFYRYKSLSQRRDQHCHAKKVRYYPGLRFAAALSRNAFIVLPVSIRACFSLAILECQVFV